MIQKFTYTLAEASRALGIGRTTLYKLKSSGQIQFLKIGDRTVIHRDEVERFAASLPKAA